MRYFVGRLPAFAAWQKHIASDSGSGATAKDIRIGGIFHPCAQHGRDEIGSLRGFTNCCRHPAPEQALEQSEADSAAPWIGMLEGCRSSDALASRISNDTAHPRGVEKRKICSTTMMECYSRHRGHAVVRYAASLHGRRWSSHGK